MREFHYLLHEFLARGLLPDDRLRRGTPGLVGCSGLQPVNGVLVAQKRLGYPESWPSPLGTLPMLLVSSEGSLLVYNTAGDLVISQVALDGPGTPAVLTTVADEAQDPHLLWQYQDLEGTLWATNGAAMLTRLDGEQPELYTEGLIPVSLCSALNRLFFAGLQNWEPEMDWWSEIFNEWKSVAQLPTIIRDSLQPSDAARTVFWGAPGGADNVQPYVLELALLQGTNYEQLRPMLLTAIRNQLFGMVHVPTQGEIHAILPLGSRLMVYCSTDCWMIPLDAETGPVALRIANFGIPGRGAVVAAGGDNLFVSNEGRLYRIDNEYRLKELRFQEHLENLILHQLVLCHNRTTGDTWIHDQVSGYVLRQELLAQCGVTPSWIYQHPTQGLLGNGEGEHPEEFEIIVSPFDMRRRAIKQIQTLECAAENTSDMQAWGIYRYDPQEAFAISEELPFNLEGVVTLQLCGVDLQVAITGKLEEDTRIESLGIKWKSGDARYVRGLVENVGVADEQG